MEAQHHPDHLGLQLPRLHCAMPHSHTPMQLAKVVYKQRHYGALTTRVDKLMNTCKACSTRQTQQHIRRFDLSSVASLVAPPCHTLPRVKSYVAAADRQQRSYPTCCVLATQAVDLDCTVHALALRCGELGHSRPCSSNIQHPGAEDERTFQEGPGARNMRLPRFVP